MEAGTDVGGSKAVSIGENAVSENGCAPLEQRLAESLDLTLTAEDLDQLKAELQGCSPCLAFIESLNTTVRLCHEFGVEQAPAPLADETRSRMVAAYERVVARRTNGTR